MNKKPKPRKPIHFCLKCGTRFRTPGLLQSHDWEMHKPRHFISATPVHEIMHLAKR